MRNEPKNGIWSSPFNTEAREQVGSRKVYFADCTLRDGEQQAGLAFDCDAKVRIAVALAELGVYEIEAGTPATSEVDRDAIAEICRLPLEAKVSVFCRGIAADIDQAMELGAWGVRISLPVSRLERKHKLKDISDEDYLKKALEIASYARKAGAYVIFSPYDTTRAELPFLRRLVSDLEQSGFVDRLRIVDTTGCALPQGITGLVEEIRYAAPSLALEIHCHNDFGLACADTLAGVLAGADYVSSTINGLGERSGNTATEEIAMALEGLYGVDTGLNLSKLTSVSRLVSELSGVRMQPNKAVVGENAFRHESGMVVAGVIEDPFTAESYAPEIVGQRRQILLGKKSGLASIAFKVDELDLAVNESDFSELLKEVKESAIDRGRALTDEEFVELTRSFGAA